MEKKTEQYPSRKRLNLSDVKQENVAPIDRLSALPDDVICHILSFLPTKISMSTSVLAKRWRFLWAHVPSLDFDTADHNENSNVGRTFSDVIYRIMLRYKVQDMEKFRLNYTDECGDYQLEMCITTAIVRNVKNLYIGLGNQSRLPRCIFTYGNLVYLWLHRCGEIPMCGPVFLPALKKLQLFMVKYETRKSLEHLFSGCPVLDEMTVRRKEADAVVFCYIYSPTLNRLTLKSSFKPNIDTYRVKIYTPALRYLQLWDYSSNDLSCGSLTSLIEADVSLRNDALIKGDVLYSQCVLRFVSSLCNVKSLKLTTGKMEVPDSAFSTLTIKFHNLTELVLNSDWRFITDFLENADNLEVLIIHVVDDHMKKWMEPATRRPASLCSLRTISIDNFGCTEQEFDMVKYLLGNAKVLKRIEIMCPYYYSVTAKYDAIRRISKFERGSEACQLDFH